MCHAFRLSGIDLKETPARTGGPGRRQRDGGGGRLLWIEPEPSAPLTLYTNWSNVRYMVL